MLLKIEFSDPKTSTLNEFHRIKIDLKLKILYDFKAINPYLSKFFIIRSFPLNFGAIL